MIHIFTIHLLTFPQSTKSPGDLSKDILTYLWDNYIQYVLHLLVERSMLNGLPAFPMHNKLFSLVMDQVANL
jgi:hypothetical protein